LEKWLTINGVSISIALNSGVVVLGSRRQRFTGSCLTRGAVISVVLQHHWGHVPCYVYLLMTLLMVIGGLWVLGALVFCLALCAAARVAAPVPDSHLAAASGATSDTITVTCRKSNLAETADFQLADAA
jgi:hypothetical protein